DLGSKRRPRHEYVAGTIELRVDGLGKPGRVAVVQVDLVLAGDLLEGRHRHVHLVAGVFRHVAELAPRNAALLVNHLDVVANARVDAHAGEGEYAAHRDGAANDDVLA